MTKTIRNAEQSAPAGEREAFEAWLSSLKFVSGQGQAHIDYCLHRDLSDKYTTEWVSDMYRGWQAGAAWQRTQAAGVPEGWRSSLEDAALMLEAHSPGSGSVESYAAQDIRAMLAAAPAQPAVQVDDWLTLAHEMEALGNRYWKAAVRERGHGAVQWLRNEETGCMFVFTRGEYADQLQEFCASLPLAQVKRAQPAAPPAQPEVQRLREALEEVADPVRFMRSRLQEGEQLNGPMALHMANSAEYLKIIAKAALAASTGQEV